MSIDREHFFTSTDKYEKKLDGSLAGRTFRLAMDNGAEYELRFVTGEIVEWRTPGQTLRWEKYGAEKVDDKTTFVASVLGFTKINTCVTLVLDEENSLVTMAISRMGLYPLRPRLVDVEFIFGAIRVMNQPLPYKRHCFTSDLLGKQISWHYSTDFINTQIYTEGRYYRIRPLQQATTASVVAQQSMDDKERAAGTRPEKMLYEEPARYIKIKDGIYLVSFIEENMNKVEFDRGGNNLMLLINAKEGFDVGRTFSLNREQKLEHGLMKAWGEFTDEDVEMAHEPTPYRV